jgi:hypothetical protein
VRYLKQKAVLTRQILYAYIVVNLMNLERKCIISVEMKANVVIAINKQNIYVKNV